MASLLSVRPYESKDLESFKELLVVRGMNLEISKELPEIGYLCFEDNFLISAAFLRRIEGGFGILDGLITDPRFSSHQRSKAIDLVVGCLLNRAKELGLKKIISYTDFPSVLLRSKNHGFKEMREQMIGLDFGGEK